MTTRDQDDLFDAVLRLCRDPVINDADTLARIGEIQMLLGSFLHKWAQSLERQISEYVRELTPTLREILGPTDKHGD